MRAILRTLVAATIMAAPQLVTAHPVDEVVQGAYVTLAPGKVALELDLTAGTEVAGQVLALVDTNSDRTVDDGEAIAFAQSVVAQSETTLDGALLTMSLDHISLPAYDAIAAATDVIRIYAFAPMTDAAGPHQLTYANHFAPAKTQRMANIFLQPGSEWSYQVTAQQHRDDNSILTVDFTTAAQ